MAAKGEKGRSVGDGERERGRSANLIDSNLKWSRAIMQSDCRSLDELGKVCNHEQRRGLN